MAINLAVRYDKQMATLYSQKAIVNGKTNKDYSFIGAQTIKLLTPVTQPLTDYRRSGTNRYGEPTEVQDTIQTLTLSKDRSFSLTVDKGNYKDQLSAKRAGEILNLQIDERVTPEVDKYALGRFADLAGQITAVATASSKTNIIDLLAADMIAMSNKKVPVDSRYIYISWSEFGKLALSDRWISNEKLGRKVLEKGVLGQFMGADVVPVPDDYLKKGNVSALWVITDRRAVMQPTKIADYFVKNDPPGINGALIEGRVYYDAFVIGAKADGVIATVAQGAQQAAPSISISGTTLTLTAVGASKVLYTTDGSDPRYSGTAMATTSGGTATLPIGDITVRAVAMSDTLFTSAVAELTTTVAEQSPAA